jgi:ABC-2 type transport system permease protein
LFRALYRYRWLVYELVLRDVIVRYRGSVLGLLWTLITPLLSVLIYVVVFSFFLRINVPNYAAFLIAGLLPWQWFATALAAATNSIVEGRMYLANTVLAPVVLVVVPVASSFVHFFLSFAIATLIAMGLHIHLGWSMAALPLLFAVQAVLTLALALFAATLNVFYRDAQQLVGILLTLVFYLIPIAYPLTLVPARFQEYILANPITILVLGYQSIFYKNEFPNWAHLLYALGVSLVLLFLGRLTFNRYKESFAEYI